MNEIRRINQEQDYRRDTNLGVSLCRDTNYEAFFAAHLRETRNEKAVMAYNRFSLDKQVEDERNDKIAMMNDVDDERKAFEG